MSNPIIIIISMVDVRGFLNDIVIFNIHTFSWIDVKLNGMNKEPRCGHSVVC